MNRIERDFQLALALRCNEWSLGDNGMLSTVIQCEVCDHDETFESREDATSFLNNGEECPVCNGWIEEG
jgi:hypothetical protein